MQDVLPDGGVVRKLWIGETDKYGDHLLRLDPASRRNRFGGGVADDFIRSYVDLTISLEAVVHGFFVDGEMRGAAELRHLGAVPAPGRSGDQRRKGLAEPRRRLGAVAAHVARRAQSRFPAVAYGLPRRQSPHAAAWRANSTPNLSFDFGSVVGEVEFVAANPLSVMQELMADSHGFATAMLDLHSRCCGHSTVRCFAPSAIPGRQRIGGFDDIRSATDRRARREQHEPRNLERRRAVVCARGQIIGDLPARRFAQPRQRYMRRIFASFRLEPEPLQAAARARPAIPSAGRPAWPKPPARAACGRRTTQARRGATRTAGAAPVRASRRCRAPTHRRYRR